MKDALIIAVLAGLIFLAVAAFILDSKQKTSRLTPELWAYMNLKSKMLDLGDRLMMMNEDHPDIMSFESFSNVWVEMFPAQPLALSSTNPFPSILPPAHYMLTPRLPHGSSVTNPFVWRRVRLHDAYLAVWISYKGYVNNGTWEEFTNIFPSSALGQLNDVAFP